MGKKAMYYTNLANHIEELRLPTKGLRLRTELESLLIGLDATVFRGLYHAFKWLMRCARVSVAVLGTPWGCWLLVGTAIVLGVAYGI